MDSPTILLVEDEPLIADMVAVALGDGGFSVTSALGGAEAQEVLASRVQIQGLITDINLPGDISGWQVARAARRQFPHIAVVYATGHGELDWQSEGVPGSVLITKPYAPAQAVTALAQLINESG